VLFRSDQRDPFEDVNRGSGRGPGWERAAARSGEWRSGASPAVGLNRSTARRDMTINARPLSSSVGGAARDDIAIGARVHHSKFGMGTIKGQDGNKLEIDFDSAGLKMVLDSFVNPA
jgi:DNA helicase-2/ATP-dependent DNA helicase PcrA